MTKFSSADFGKSYLTYKGLNCSIVSRLPPLIDGQTEVVNKFLETYLHCFALEQPRCWGKWLHWAEYWYNTNIHTASVTPFPILYGWDTPPLIHNNHLSTPVSEEEHLEERDAFLDDLKFQILCAQQIMKSQADKHRRELSFSVGDWVFVKLRPYRQQSLASKKYDKLAARCYGPFQIVSRLRTVAYKLNLP